MGVFSLIKDWLKEHDKVWKIAVVVVIALIALTIARLLFLENNNKGENNSESLSAEFTTSQQNICNNYDDDTLKFINLLKNNRWLSAQKTANAIFEDRQIIERKNEETHYSTYAICNLEKGYKDRNSCEQPYYFTCLLSDGRYVQSELWIRYIGTTESSPVETVYILGENLFWGADSYERCVPVEDVVVENWDSSANTLIDGKTEQMKAKLKEYMFLYYPQIGKLHWNFLAGINYYDHTVGFNFGILINDSNITNIVCEYNKDSGTFKVGKAQSADAIAIKKTAM